MAKIIAEICQNHLGDRALLRDLIQAAAENGADIIKGQIIFSEDLTHRPQVEAAIKRPYLAELERLRKLDLTEADYHFFVEEVKKIGKTPLLAVFAKKRIPLAASLPWSKPKLVKVPSYDCASYPFISDLAQHFDKLIISTGASFDGEIAKTAKLLHECHKPFVFLHCVTSYPNTVEAVNLSRLSWLRQFTPEVGWSDHTLVARDGLRASKITLMLGADYIERHFTILPADQTKDGPISITPLLLQELAEFARWPREDQRAYIEQGVPDWQMMIGLPQREMAPTEMLNRDYYRGRFASCEHGRWVYNWE